MKKSETTNRQEPVRRKKTQYENAIITVSNTLARSGNNYTTSEFKLFLLSLSQANTRDEKGWITLNKADTLEKLGLSNTNQTNLRKTALRMAKKSIFEFEGNTPEEWLIAQMVPNIRSTRNTLEIQLNETLAPLYENLTTHFTTLYLDYICGLNSRHAISLYLYLSSWFDKKYLEQNTWLKKEDIQRVFGLDKDDYKRNPGTEREKFDYPTFEKRVLIKAVDEINDSNPCDIHIQAWNKTYKGRQVTGYNFTWGPIDPTSRKWNATPLNLLREDNDPFKGVSDEPQELFSLDDLEKNFKDIFYSVDRK